MSEKKPTIVLVHGAFAEAASWNGVIEQLQAESLDAIAVANPLRSVAGDAAYVRDVIASVGAPVVLVGHSYGGAVITNAALGNGLVEALVYVDAFIPAEHDTLVSLTQPGSCFAAPPETVLDFVPIPSAPAGVADAYVKPSVFAGTASVTVFVSPAASGTFWKAASCFTGRVLLPTKSRT